MLYTKIEEDEMLINITARITTEQHTEIETEQQIIWG